MLVFEPTDQDYMAKKYSISYQKTIKISIIIAKNF